MRVLGRMYRYVIIYTMTRTDTKLCRMSDVVERIVHRMGQMRVTALERPLVRQVRNVLKCIWYGC